MKKDLFAQGAQNTKASTTAIPLPQNAPSFPSKDTPAASASSVPELSVTKKKDSPSHEQKPQSKRIKVMPNLLFCFFSALFIFQYIQQSENLMQTNFNNGDKVQFDENGDNDWKFADVVEVTRRSSGTPLSVQLRLADSGRTEVLTTQAIKTRLRMIAEMDEEGDDNSSHVKNSPNNDKGEQIPVNDGKGTGGSSDVGGGGGGEEGGGGGKKEREGEEKEGGGGKDGVGGEEAVVPGEEGGAGGGGGGGGDGGGGGGGGVRRRGGTNPEKKKPEFSQKALAKGAEAYSVPANWRVVWSDRLSKPFFFNDTTCLGQVRQFAKKI